MSGLLYRQQNLTALPTFNSRAFFTTSHPLDASTELCLPSAPQPLPDTFINNTQALNLCVDPSWQENIYYNSELALPFDSFASDNYSLSFCYGLDSYTLSSLAHYYLDSFVATDFYNMVEDTLKDMLDFGAHTLLPIAAEAVHTFLENIAHTLHFDAAPHFAEATEKLSRIFPEQNFGTMYARLKTVNSICSKLIKIFAKKITGFEFLQLGAQFMESAKEEINDSIGIRLVLKDSSRQGSDAFFLRLMKAIADKEITITRIRNYASDGKDKAYLTQNQLAQLVQLITEVNGKEPEVKTKPKDSGYTGFQINFLYKDGSEGDFQVRGKLVDWIACGEHFIYKVFDENSSELPDYYKTPELLQFQESLKSLTDEEIKLFKDFIRASYIYFRDQELGVPVNERKHPIRPSLPNEFIRKHSFFNLRALYNYIKQTIHPTLPTVTKS